MTLARVAGCVGVALTALAFQSSEVGWVANGGDAFGTRYLPAAEITRGNVNRLEVAWTYRTGEADPRFATKKAASFEATPLVVDGTMYVGTPLGRVIALDPATGRERWVFDPQIARDVTYGDFASRGVSTWLDESAQADAVCRRRIFVATAQSQLFALDAADGQPCAGFGQAGMVDLKVGLRIPPFEPQAYSMTSPPIGRERRRRRRARRSPTTPGPISRAGRCERYDARTGARKWTWDPVPQDQNDPAYASGGRDGAQDGRGQRVVGARCGSGARAGLRSNRQCGTGLLRWPAAWRQPVRQFDRRAEGVNRRDRVGVPDGSPRSLGLRQRLAAGAGDVDARGGSPCLRCCRRTKTGMLFVLNRETGAPIFPRRGAPRAGERYPSRASFEDAAVHCRHPAAQSSPLHCGSSLGTVGERSRSVPRGDRRAAQRRHLHAAERPGHAGHAVQHRRRTLGRRGCRSRATDCGRAGQPPRRDGAIDSARGIRSRTGAREGDAPRLRLRVQLHARHAVHHAPAHSAVALAPAVHTAAIRHAGRRRSRDRGSDCGRFRSAPCQALFRRIWRRR